MQHRIAAARKCFVMLATGLLILIMGSVVVAQEGHGHAEGEGRPELTTAPSVPLNPADGLEIGFVYEAYLSPHQEGGEEEETPLLIPPQFRSTAPSVPRADRTSRGHSIIEFTRDLSRAYVYLAVENVNPADIVMLHLHCGRPAQLGPILIDFSLAGDVPTYLQDGYFAIEVTNADITSTTATTSSIVDVFTIGCAIDNSNPNEKVRTIAGMEQIARRGELYFNLHTAGQVYFGDIRGQFQLRG